MHLKRLRIVAAVLGTLGTLGALAGPAAAFTLRLSEASFGPAGVTPVFSGVESFALQIDLAGPLVPGGVYDNASIVLVQYVVGGALSTSPPTPSGFPAFLLNRTPTGEGPISPADWIGQGSSLGFEVAASADLADGLQLSELVPDAEDRLLSVDAREFERLDRARYHPLQLLLDADGSGLLRNSNNSSGSTGTLNPATQQTVDVDFGEEYVTALAFDPRLVTLVVPEPGTGILIGLGLALVGLAGRRAEGPRAAP